MANEIVDGGKEHFATEQDNIAIVRRMYTDVFDHQHLDLAGDSP
jgi:hypothetical protein